MTLQVSLFFGETPTIQDALASVVPHKSADVLRVIETKSGPFVEVTDGKPTGREFQILELNDGRFVWQFTDDGERRPATRATTPVLISDAIRYGTFREVSE